MNERQYLDSLAKRTADNVTATVESRNDDGTYQVREIGSRAIMRASKANPADEFALRSRVIVSRPSASRNVLGSESVILSRAPRDQKGLSETTPAESRQSFARAFILSVDPDPLILVAGGPAGEQVFTGGGFTAAAEYVATAAGIEDPLITDSVAPDVEPTKITMTISADADSPLGNFSAAIGTLRARNALTILASIPAQPPYYAIVGTGVGGAGNPAVILWVLDPVTLDVITTSEVRGADVAATALGLTSIDGVIYWLTADAATNNAYTLHAFNPSTGIRTDFAPLASSTVDFVAQGELRYFDGRLFICSKNSTTRGLVSFLTDGTDLRLDWADSLVNSRIGLDIDDDAIYVTASGGTKRLDRVTFAVEATTGNGGLRALPLRAWAAGVYGAFTGILCVVGTGTARWMNSTTLADTATVATGNPHHGPVQIDDKVYMMGRTDHVLYRVSLDGATVDVIATMESPTSAIRMSFVTDGVDIFYARSDDSIRRVGVDGSTLVTSSPLLSSDPTETITLDSAIYVP